MTTAAPEPIRLVVWDLDETFWHGTLTEGGMTYRRDLHDAVITLARRGIISSICSKNDPAVVEELLRREGLWDYFVFPSISWEAKGPRLAALIEAVQLRAPTILFIDDNPHNLAEAAHFVPGIQLAGPEILDSLLDHPLTRGKDDAALTRLAQYRLLQQRHADARTVGDSTEFLRASGIQVEIEFDIAPHLDRAIELINRTNQLNFTKRRLPESAEAARAYLRKTLAHPDYHAGIVRVRDRYGDYGWCGFFLLNHSRRTGKSLEHFAFSCRILNMGVETWLYRRLGRPALQIVGDVLADPAGDTREIDWIELAQLGEGGVVAPTGAHMLDVVYARGACHVRPMSHYFGMVASEVIEEFDTVRDGRTMQLNHSQFAHYAIHGATEAQRDAMMRLGYTQRDFASFITAAPGGVRQIWVLNFWTESGANLMRHRDSGALIPVAFNPEAARAMRERLGPAAAADFRNWTDDAPGVDAAILRELRAGWDFVGATPDAVLTRNVTDMLRQAPPGTLVIILMANDVLLKADGSTQRAAWVQRINQLVADAAAPFPHVSLLDVRDCMNGTDDLVVGQPLKFGRAVFFRIYEEILRRWKTHIGD